MVRRAWLHAGLPQPTGATTIDAQCGSGQQSAHFVNDLIKAGTIYVGIACGVESMSRIPLGANVPAGMGDPRPDVVGHRHAEPVPRRRPDRREPRADPRGPRGVRCRVAARAAAAVDEGRFEREITPLEAPVVDKATATPTGEIRVVAADEGLRETTLEGLARLQAGAAGRAAHGRYVVADQRRRVRGAADGLRGLAALARTRRRVPGSSTTPWSARTRTTTSTGPSTRPGGCSSAPGMSLDDFDLFEVNEAFAAVVLSWAQQTGARPRRTNVNGGAIALGHPVGSTGTRLITTALHELERTDGTRALISMCAGGAMATGTVLERV